MRLVYVFDYMEVEGYLFRAPVFIARWYVRWANRRGALTLDYARTHTDLV